MFECQHKIHSDVVQCTYVCVAQLPTVTAHQKGSTYLQQHLTKTITVIRITIATTPATTPPAIVTILTDWLSSLVACETTQRHEHVTSYLPYMHAAYSSTKFFILYTQANFHNFGKHKHTLKSI